MNKEYFIKCFIFRLLFDFNGIEMLINPIWVLAKIGVQIQLSLRNWKMDMLGLCIGFSSSMEFCNIIVGATSCQVKPTLVFVDKLLSPFFKYGFSELVLCQVRRNICKLFNFCPLPHLIEGIICFRYGSVELIKRLGIDK